MPEPTGGIATLGINLNIFIAQLVNFVVVLLVLWKFAYKPIVKILDDRSKKIELCLFQANEVDARMKKLEIEQKEIIATAKREATLILEAAKQEAEARKLELISSAKKDVEYVVIKGKEQLRSEKTQMLQDAKTELIEMVVSATKKILEKEVDEKASQKIAAEVIAKMSKDV